MRYYGKIHSRLPIFRVKSVKNYTGQKKFTVAPVAPVTYMRYASRTPPALLQYLCMRKSNMFSLFRYVSPPSSYFRNLLIFWREERRVYIMQKLDCRIPNWRTFLELMSYFPRLSRDLRKKIFQTAQHAGINLSTHFFSKKPNTKMWEEYERKFL